MSKKKKRTYISAEMLNSELRNWHIQKHSLNLILLNYSTVSDVWIHTSTCTECINKKCLIFIIFRWILISSVFMQYIKTVYRYKTILKNLQLKKLHWFNYEKSDKVNDSVFSIIWFRLLSSAFQFLFTYFKNTASFEFAYLKEDYNLISYTICYQMY